MRDLTPEMVAEFSGQSVQPVLMAEFFFDSQTIGMFTGYGTLQWGDKEFLGGGNFIGLSPMEETQELEAKGVVLSLNGIPSNLVALALNENVKNRPVRIYLASIDTQRRVATEDEPGAVLTEGGDYVLLENNLIDSPYQIFSGLMDVMEFADSGDTADIRVTAENILLIGQRAKLSRYTDEEQRKRFPDDRGLEFINRLQDREIVW